MSSVAKPTYSMSIRVYYEDTDAGGVVYYANYLRFMERARTEWLGALGYAIDKLVDNSGLMFVVRSAELSFISPARLNEELSVSVTLDKLSGASMIVTQRVTRTAVDTTACEGVVRIACVDANTFRPKRLPNGLVQDLNEWN